MGLEINGRAHSRGAQGRPRSAAARRDVHPLGHSSASAAIAEHPLLTSALQRSHARSVKLSILMPAYNEERTIAEAVASVLSTKYPCDYELIVVDDGSTDRTPELLAEFSHEHLVVVTHPHNFGKGAALQSASAVATGTHLVPFDADLEYDPNDLRSLLEPVLKGQSDVVYGVRLFGVNTRYQSFRHAIGNQALTMAARVLFDAYLSDMHTCLKLVPLELFRELEPRELGFGLDTEITAKLLRKGIKPFEVPVSYNSRSVANGKKITWRDGVRCLQILGRVRSTPGIDAPRQTDRQLALVQG
jgi:glycosyltransferase involved in cell wall biosynthesis